MGNSNFQFFVDNIKRELWNALSGKYGVCIDIASGKYAKSVCMIVVFREDSPIYAVDMASAFYECSKNFGGNLRNYSEFLSKEIAQRNLFLSGKESKE